MPNEYVSKDLMIYYTESQPYFRSPDSAVREDRTSAWKVHRIAKQQGNLHESGETYNSGRLSVSHIWKWWGNSSR